MDEVSKIVIVGGGIAAAKACVKLRDLGWAGAALSVVTSRGASAVRTTAAVQEVCCWEAGHIAVWSAYVETEDCTPSTGSTCSPGPRSGCRRRRLIDPRRQHDAPVRQAAPSHGAPVPGPSRSRRSGASSGVGDVPRTIEDSLRIRDRLIKGACVILVGGGWICMEVAAAARTAGCQVVVLETRGTCPCRVILGREVAQRFTDVHRDHGVEIRTGAVVTESQRWTTLAARVLLAHGERLAADLVIIGIGAEPTV